MGNGMALVHSHDTTRVFAVECTNGFDVSNNVHVYPKGGSFVFVENRYVSIVSVIGCVWDVEKIDRNTLAKLIKCLKMSEFSVVCKLGLTE